MNNPQENDLPNGAPGADPSDDEPSVEELREQLAAETARREAAEQERERWREQATAKPAEKAKADETPDLDDLSQVDLVDIVSGNNVEGLSKVVQTTVRQVLKGMGVTTKKDVEDLVTSRLSEAKSESTGMAELVNQYPDLADRDSELYQEAARQLEEIGKDSAYGQLSDFAKVKLAAKLAAAQVGKGGSRKSAEAARVARIGAQQGSTGSRAGSRRGEESDELSDEERAAAKIFGVSEKEFIENKRDLKMFRR